MHEFLDNIPAQS